LAGNGLRIRSEECEAGLHYAVAFDRFYEHAERSNPPTGIAVKRPVHDVRFLRFGVLRHGDHFVFVAFEVAVSAEWDHGIPYT